MRSIQNSSTLLTTKIMKPASFYLHNWEYWTPDHPIEKSDTTPALLRRRVSSLGRHALSVAWELPEAANARLILSSRHGEFSRTLSLLEAVNGQGELSPADFTLSVHNALIGLLSIAHGNRRGHTAIAAGQESFCFGLLEAVAYLKENPDEPVLLIHFDEPLPGSFAEFNEPYEQPIVLALALGATGKNEMLQIDFESTPHEEKISCSHAQDFLNFLMEDSIQEISMSADRQWRWKRNVLA